MPAPDQPMAIVQQLTGYRIVDDPANLDTVIAALPAQIAVLRFAPDEALIVGGSAFSFSDAIVEPETGFVAVTVDREIVARHTEWPLPAAGGVAQGAIAGVPSKLVWLPDGRAWIVTQAAYVADLLDRLT